VRYPFKVLAHYYHDLSDIRDGYLENLHKSSKGNFRADTPDYLLKEPDEVYKETLYDLNVLLDYYDRYYIQDLKSEEVRHQSGVVSYKLLWFLFKPGCNVHARVGGKLAGFIFDRGEERSYRGRNWWEAYC
jgi:hypothetical protein